MHWILESPTQNINETSQDFAQKRLVAILEEKGISFTFHKISINLLFL